MLHDAAGRSGLSSISLWAAAPHYVVTGPNPKAALALLDALTPVLGLPVEPDGLRATIGPWEARVNDAVEGDEDMLAYVRRLEEIVDSSVGELDEDATGESIAEELERFLRGGPERG